MCCWILHLALFNCTLTLDCLVVPNAQDFPRLKIGIGRPPGQMATADYVLQTFSRADLVVMAVAVQESIATVKAVLGLGLEKAMSGIRL